MPRHRSSPAVNVPLQAWSIVKRSGIIQTRDCDAYSNVRRTLSFCDLNDLDSASWADCMGVPSLIPLSFALED